MLIVRFWGVRGSIPTPGPATVKVGGNTSCVEVRCGKDLVIFDAGTGIRLLGNQLLREMPVTAHLLFSHVHWDHIQGFPFFVPAFIPGNTFRLYGQKNVTGTISETLAGQMNYPSFPVGLADMGATFHFHDLQEGQVVELPGGGRIRNARLNHPNDGVPKTGWGHSTNEEAARVALAVGAKRLVLFHHDPTQNDEAVEAKETGARAIFPDAVAAREGLVIEL
jgi:phosphoribosyl 1,2-cyclic phosphodiesterase